MTTEAIMQFLILMLAMIAAGAIGYWLAREKYRGRSIPYKGHQPIPTSATPRAKMAPTVQ
jgi:hypothetical protein